MHDEHVDVLGHTNIRTCKYSNFLVRVICEEGLTLARPSYMCTCIIADPTTSKDCQNALKMIIEHENSRSKFWGSMVEQVSLYICSLS